RKTGHADDRTYPQRMADALVELARRSLDAGDLPQVAVQRPHVILIATAEALDGEAGAPAARLDGVGPVSSATAQMVCCDAETDRANLPHPPLTEPATGTSSTRAARNASRPGSSGSRSSPETRPASAAARPRPAARSTDHANLPHPPTPKEHATWDRPTRTTSA
ncbi:MAG: DUF222 domain-containing protein, partial [Egibacteraceae bacterium]